jgi:hypothetical protein
LAWGASAPHVFLRKSVKTCKFFIKPRVFEQKPLETAVDIGYNTGVYPQFSHCVMNPQGQMRGNDLP